MAVTRAVLLVVLAAAVVLLLAWAFQGRLVYLPSGTVPAAPADVEEAAYTTADGLSLDGWWVPARDGGDGSAVLVLPGNAGNRSLRLPLARALADAGAHVLLVDYRGYGGNPGTPDEAGLAADARAALAHLLARPEVDAERVAYLGESLGAAVAIRLAVEEPPAALALRSPFTSLAGVGRLHYPWLPVRLLLRDRYRSLDRIGDVDAPVLVVAGSADAIVPAVHSRRVHDAAAEPKRWVAIPGAGHNDRALLDGDRLVGELTAFLSGHGVGEASEDGPGG